MPELERCPECGNLTVTTVPAGEPVGDATDATDAGDGSEPFKQCMTAGCVWTNEPRER
jgi:hypothetical protein